MARAERYAPSTIPGRRPLGHRATGGRAMSKNCSRQFLSNSRPVASLTGSGVSISLGEPHETKKPHTLVGQRAERYAPSTIPGRRPVGQPSAVQNRSIRFCRTRDPGRDFRLSRRVTGKTKRPPELGGLFVLLARPERFELPTSWFVAMRSIQLSYGRVVLANPVLVYRWIILR